MKCVVGDDVVVVVVVMVDDDDDDEAVDNDVDAMDAAVVVLRSRDVDGPLLNYEVACALEDVVHRSKMSMLFWIV